MRSVLFVDLMRFALSKKNTKERLRYVVLSMLYYAFLSHAISAGEKGGSSALSNQAGDDIYPLF
jgi:hypothetical protein